MNGRNQHKISRPAAKLGEGVSSLGDFPAAKLGERVQSRNTGEGKRQ